MKSLPNQSLRWPSSSMAISEPRPMAMRADADPVALFEKLPSFIFSGSMVGEDRGEHEDAGDEVDEEVPFPAEGSVSKPPMCGPDRRRERGRDPEHAPARRPRRFFGMSVTMTVSAVGMNTPPVKPWPARKTIISPRFVEMPHSAEKIRKSTTLHQQIIADGENPAEPGGQRDGDDLADQIARGDPASLHRAWRRCRRRCRAARNW